MSRSTLSLVGALLLAPTLALVACRTPATEAPGEPPATEVEATQEPPSAPPPADTSQPEAAEPPQVEVVPIITTASDVTGIGTNVAAEAFALTLPEGEGDEAVDVVQAVILPFGIYPDMHVESLADFEGPESAAEGFSFDWQLAPPDGSTAALTVSGDVAVFLADVGGDYELTLTATNAAGLSNDATWTVRAANYVGAGGIAGAAGPGQCSMCHTDKAEEWVETGHAKILAGGIDGTVSEHYGERCIRCHATGYNNRPEAVNGGFDDVQAEYGWVFPTELKEGNWDALKAEYPEVAGMGLIQCESCHGPGSDHNAGDASDGPISVSLASGNCAQCHAEQTHHVFPMQWEVSAHSKRNGAFASSHVVGNSACAKCHSGVGYIDTAAGQEKIRSDYQIVTCAVCHDPHDASNPAQLRVYDTTLPLPDGSEVTGVGPAATCISCHQSRRDAAQVEGDEPLSLPHYSTAAELVNRTGGYTWGEEVENSPHGALMEGQCIGCHMADTPGMDDAGTPDDASDDKPLPGHNTVGGHTFMMTSPVDGTQNVAVCQACHQGVESFEFDAKSDYDGDGTVESNQAEIEGLRAQLHEAIIAAGVVDLGRYPYFELPEDAGVDLRGAVWNYKYTSGRGSAVHNFKHTLGLLQLSLEKMGAE